MKKLLATLATGALGGMLVGFLMGGYSSGMWEVNSAGAIVPTAAAVVDLSGSSILLPQADLTAGSCDTGQVALDTGGLTKEICLCGPANTWNCVSIGLVGGPLN